MKMEIHPVDVVFPTMILTKPKRIVVPGKKRVRFGAPKIVEQLPSLDDISAEEKANTWWSPLATKEIHRAAKTLGKEAIRNKWMVEGYEQGHQTARHMASSIKDEESLFRKLEEVEIDVQLIDWCKYGHSRRGLERRSSKSHDSARTDAAKRAKKVVLKLVKAKEDDETIRLAYERSSCASRIFARFMGEADALAVTKRIDVVVKRRSSDDYSSKLVLTDGSCDSSLQSS